MRLACVPLLAALTACGSGDGGPAKLPDAAPLPDAAAAVDAGPPDAVPVDAGRTSTGGAVAWSPDLPNPQIFTIDHEVALDYGLFYTVLLPTPNDPLSTLEITICAQPAGAAEECFSDEQLAEAGQHAVRWGIDPSQYSVGLNLYSHTLRLKQGPFEVDSEVLRWEVTYTPAP